LTKETIPDSWRLVESGNFSQIPMLIGSNRDDALMLTLRTHLSDPHFEQLSDRWETEICPAVVFHR
jgi:hypothetical protein